MSTDLDVPWAGDLTITATGDIAVISGGDKVLQRVVRRFLTNPQNTDTLGRVTDIPDYLFHPLYGGGARQYVDNPTNRNLQNSMQQSFAVQASVEEGVAADPPCSLTVSQQDLYVTLNCVVYYADSVVPTVGNVRLS